MQFRNAQSLGDGRFDCEIDHPIHGWIPYTLDPADTDNAVNNVALRAAIGKDFEAYVAPTAAEVVLINRSNIVPISPLQGILTLGEKEWNKVLAFRDGVDADGVPLATWAQKVIINSALDWRRTSQNIAFFGHLLDYTDAQMDALFIAAAQVRA